MLRTTIAESCNTAPLMSCWQITIAAFLARIMEDRFLSLQGLRTRLADDRFRDVFRAMSSCDPWRDYGLTSNKFPSASGTAAHCRVISLTRVGEKSRRPHLRCRLSRRCHRNLSSRTPNSFLRPTRGDIFHVRYLHNVHLTSLFAVDSKAENESPVPYHPFSPSRRVVH